MVESAAIVHVNFVIVFQVGHQRRNITNDSAFRSSIGAIIGSIDTLGFMFKFTVIGVYARAPKTLIFTWKFQRSSNFLQCKTSYIAKFMPASGAPVVHPGLATRTQCVTI